MMTTTPGRPVRLGIVNDFQVVVDGLEAMLAGHTRRVVAIRGKSASGGVRDLDRDLDLVLFDPFAHGEDLAATMAQLTAAGHDDVVVFTWHRSQVAQSRAVELGVAGYLPKTLTGEELVGALERIHDGERVVMPVPRKVAASGIGDWPGRQAGLTPRESEVLCLIAQGLTNLEITELAYLGPESLKTHIRSAYAKIGVTRRSQAIVWCVHHGLTNAHAET